MEVVEHNKVVAVAKEDQLTSQPVSKAARALPYSHMMMRLYSEATQVTTH